MKVICFGDSNTYGYDPRSCFGSRYDRDSRWVDILAEKTGWDILNLGENGRAIPAAAVSFPAGTDLLIVMLGINDLLMGRSPEAATERMAHFLTSLELERNKILLVAPPPVVPGTWVPDRRLVGASAALAKQYQLLTDRLGIRFADAGAWNVSLSYDGVHFTPHGHRAFADGLFRELSQST